MNSTELYPLVSIAPMMEWTDRHCRYFLRLISRHALLYSEMVTSGAVLNGDRDYLLGFDLSEHPVALQLGGSDPAELARCARIGAEYGYDEINLNVGCPSDRVQSGRIGACLMAEPARVADCVASMAAVVDVPVTVKCRIGIDDHDSYAALSDFVSQVAAAGTRRVIVHARKAILQGLSPKQNREVPPLCYERVYQLKRDFPQLHIVINGGITTLDQVDCHLHHVDGVMIGREAYHNPYCLADVDRRFYDDQHAVPTRQQVVERMLPYIEAQLSAGAHLKYITRHMLGLFQGVPGARVWRRHLSEQGPRHGAGPEVVEAALAKLMCTQASGLA